MSYVIRNRKTGILEPEQIYGEKAISFLYGDKALGKPLMDLVCKFPLFSMLYGKLQSSRASAKKVKPFIENFDIDASEFEKQDFASFNDFFTRKLKPGARPLATTNLVIPADGRFLAFQNISKSDGFFVKGQKFDLAKLLHSESLADRYHSGTMVIARLCPTDYHHFHFPCDCRPGESTLINGALYSVNPIALKQNCHIFTENKRRLTLLDTAFGTVAYMEIGATSVGTIVETYSPGNHYRKGDEKGYFSFGGSALVLLFEPGRITLDPDLQQTGLDKIELRCLMGQSLGKAP